MAKNNRNADSFVSNNQYRQMHYMIIIMAYCRYMYSLWLLVYCTQNIWLIPLCFFTHYAMTMTTIAAIIVIESQLGRRGQASPDLSYGSLCVGHDTALSLYRMHFSFHGHVLGLVILDTALECIDKHKFLWALHFLYLSLSHTPPPPIPPQRLGTPLLMMILTGSIPIDFPHLHLPQHWYPHATGH